ncbi:MAG TPA: ABC transporter permease [Vicinamibacterales bacterium]|nr:ABC transporter permease [Vicinamibacterales bacterium]
MNDLRHAVRGLRKQPGFAAVAVLTLALGIGVNASLFSLVSAFFLQPLNVENPDELVMLLQRGDVIDVPYGYSYPDYQDFREQSTAFSELTAYTPTPVHLSARGQAPERTWVEVVSSNYFRLARVAPALGAFPEGSTVEVKGAAPEVVLSYRYWQRRFGADPAMVGGTITLNGRTFTVKGIAPESFTGLSWAMAVSAFVPAGALGALLEDGDAFRENRGAPAFRIMGRLAPGATVEAARAEAEVILGRLVTAYPAEHKGSRAMVIPENRARPDPSVSGVLPVFAAVLAALVALVLLIACANVANLMLSRAAARQRDLVIRSALGASRLRLMKLQLTESLILAAAAGLLGFLLAHWAGQALTAFAPAGDIPINQEHPRDWRVYVFTAAVSMLAGMFTGLWPARSATRFALVESLKQGGPVGGTSRHAFRSLLVVGQVTLSLVVLVAAALFLHSLRQLQKVSLGFRPDGLLMLSVDLGLQQYGDERGRMFLEDLVERAEALPGVESATIAVHVPFDYGIQVSDVATGEDVPGSRDGYLPAPFNVVGPGYFETLGGSIVLGRAFDSHDDRSSRRVAVVNLTMAGKLWPARDPIGRRFRFGRDGEWIDVVGVAADGKYIMVGEGPRPYFYVPLAQAYRSPATLVVRTTAEAGALASPVRRLLSQMDPDLPVFNVRTMSDHLRDSVFGFMPMRAGAYMAGVQGGIGLLLALMGLYAVVSYAVTRRTREIGVRMALGANRADILRLVVREGMRLTLVGGALGFLLALALGFGLSRVLYGVSPLDLRLTGGVTALLLLVSALACYVPALRATRVDPLIALREE